MKNLDSTGKSTMNSYVEKALKRNSMKMDLSNSQVNQKGIPISEFKSIQKQSTEPSGKPFGKDTDFSTPDPVISEVKHLTESLVNTFKPSISELSDEIPIQEELPLVIKNFYSTPLREESPIIDNKKAELIHSSNLITLRTIKDIISIIRPPQSIVNIVISYISMLAFVDIDGKIIRTNKTYDNCIKSLSNSDYAHKITMNLVNYCDKISDEDKEKLEKIRAKYLAGWDMRPEAFSDKYYSARIILNFMLVFCNYIQERDDSPRKSKDNSSSPTRKLIEHKMLYASCCPQETDEPYEEEKKTFEDYSKKIFANEQSESKSDCKIGISKEKESDSLKKDLSKNDERIVECTNKTPIKDEKTKPSIPNKEIKKNEVKKRPIKGNDKSSNEKKTDRSHNEAKINTGNRAKTPNKLRKSKKTTSKEKTDKLIFNLIKGLRSKTTASLIELKNK